MCICVCVLVHNCVCWGNGAWALTFTYKHEYSVIINHSPQSPTHTPFHSFIYTHNHQEVVVKKLWCVYVCMCAYLSLLAYVFLPDIARACVYVTQGPRYACNAFTSMWAGLQQTSLPSHGDISLARAAPLTFSWWQINLDLARCHVHLGSHL